MTGKQGEARPNVRWDTSQVRSVYPDMFRVTGGLEEIALLFGRKQAVDEESGREVVQALSRILMSPFTAKRLAITLDHAAQEYETRRGSPGLKKSLSRAEEQLQSLIQNPPFSKTDKTAEKVGPLFRFLERLQVEFGYERSFRMSESTLSGKRFLLGIKKDTVRTRPHEEIRGLCNQLNMPEELLKDFEDYLPKANVVGFGFEENRSACACKAYLEFGENFRKAIEKNRRRPAPFDLHRGFKWDPEDHKKHAIARYTCNPFLSIKTILKRMSGILNPDQYGRSLEMARQIVLAASRKIPGPKMLYMEMTEDNNPIKSFDINLYGANLRLEELDPILSDICRNYSIPSEEFHTVYNPVRTEILGHLAGGMDREGRDFLTVYHGVEGYFIP